MKKNKIGYTILEYIINILFLMSIVLISSNIFEILDLNEEVDIFDYLIIPTLINLTIYFIMYFTSIIIHELGHLYFGNKLKLNFLAFSILNFKIVKEKKKLKIKKYPMVPGSLGYCSMEFDDDKRYNSKDVILFFLGGIIFNISLAIIFNIILFTTNNDILKTISLFGIVINVYLALINSIPKVLSSGMRTDMKQIELYNKDHKYVNVFGRIQKIQGLILSGKHLRDLDEELFYIPKKTNYGNIDFTNITIDYYMSKGEYKKAITIINDLLKKHNKSMDESQINTLKLLKIECLFYTKKNLKEVNEIWDKKLDKYLDTVKSVNPTVYVFKYLYLKLVLKDLDKATKCKKELNKLISKHRNKSERKEVKAMIKEIDAK